MMERGKRKRRRRREIKDAKKDIFFLRLLSLKLTATEGMKPHPSEHNKKIIITLQAQKMW